MQDDHPDRSHLDQWTIILSIDPTAETFRKFYSSNNSLQIEFIRHQSDPFLRFDLLFQEKNSRLRVHLRKVPYRRRLFIELIYDDTSFSLYLDGQLKDSTNSFEKETNFHCSSTVGNEIESIRFDLK